MLKKDIPFGSDQHCWCYPRDVQPCQRRCEHQWQWQWLLSHLVCRWSQRRPHYQGSWWLARTHQWEQIDQSSRDLPPIDEHQLGQYLPTWCWSNLLAPTMLPPPHSIFHPSKLCFIFFFWKREWIWNKYYLLRSYSVSIYKKQVVIHLNLNQSLCLLFFVALVNLYVFVLLCIFYFLAHFLYRLNHQCTRMT